MKKKLFFVFDIFMSCAVLLFFIIYCLFFSNITFDFSKLTEGKYLILVVIILFALYQFVKSAIGIIWLKTRTRKDLDFENPELPRTWFIIIYVVNILAAFTVFMPVCQMIAFMDHRMYSYAFCYFMIIFITIFGLIGEPKWQRMINQMDIPKKFKLYTFIANPLRVFLTVLLLFAVTVTIFQ